MLLAAFGSFSCRDLSKFAVVLLNLSGVDLLLNFLGLNFLLKGTIFGNLFEVELMLSLELVGPAALGKQNAKEDDGEAPAADRVPSKDVRLDDTEGEDTPPVQRVHAPESEEAPDDLEVVSARVLINTLIVAWVNWIVSGTIAGKLGCLSLFSVRVNSMHFLSQLKKIVNKSIIKPNLLTIITCLK